MKHVTLFDNMSTDLTTRMFSVHPGQTVMLTAFGFASNQQAYDKSKPRDAQRAIVEKVAFAGGIFPDGSACEGDDGLLAEIPYTYAEDVTQCGLWNLNACQNLVFLSVPGTYRLRLNDEAALGTLYVEMVKYDRDDGLAYIPHDLYLGEVSNG
jgi:hypothetical protein